MDHGPWTIEGSLEIGVKRGSLRLNNAPQSTVCSGIVPHACSGEHPIAFMENRTNLYSLDLLDNGVLTSNNSARPSAAGCPSRTYGRICFFGLTRRGACAEKINSVFVVPFLLLRFLYLIKVFVFLRHSVNAKAFGQDKPTKEVHERL